MQNFSGRILVAGGSVRAAAASTLRGGWEPVCSDFFADADLRQMARVEPVEHYPAGLTEVTKRLPPMPWIYTGGLENCPDLVAGMSERHSLWGNDADTLRRIRDPFFLAETLHRAGLPALEVRHSAPVDVDGAVWLSKPLDGSGGRGITVCGLSPVDDQVPTAPPQAQTLHSPRSPVPSNPYPLTGEGRVGGKVEVSPGSDTQLAPTNAHYFQRYVAGESISALFLAWPGQTRLLEMTAQLEGLAEVHAPPFAWCGNIAPLVVPPEVRECVAAIGRTLAEAGELRGLFGCDFILAGGIPWLTEVNPRYTGSVELVEFLRRVPLLEWHRRACSVSEMDRMDTMDFVDEEFPSGIQAGNTNTHRSPLVAGKLVLYNVANGTAPDGTRYVPHVASNLWRLPFVADIPMPGSQLIAGQPLCTIYATATSVAACRAKLLRRAGRVYNRFEISQPETMPSTPSLSLSSERS